MLLVEAGDRLRRGGCIALDEGERGRTLEQIIQLCGSCLFSGELGETVLDNLEGRIRLAKLTAQLSRLGYLDPPVVHSEDRFG